MKKNEKIASLFAIMASSITSSRILEEMRVELEIAHGATLVATNYREESRGKVGSLSSRPRKLDGKIRLAIVVETNSNDAAGEYLHVSGCTVEDAFDNLDENLGDIGNMLITLDLKRTRYETRYSEDGLTQMVDGKNTIYLKLS